MLTEDQRRRLVAVADRRLAYLARLLSRMHALRWQRGDPVYEAVAKEYDAAEATRKALERSGHPERPPWMNAYGTG